MKLNTYNLLKLIKGNNPILSISRAFDVDLNVKDEKHQMFYDRIIRCREEKLIIVDCDKFDIERMRLLKFNSPMCRYHLSLTQKGTERLDEKRNINLKFYIPLLISIVFSVTAFIISIISLLKQ